MAQDSDDETLPLTIDAVAVSRPPATPHHSTAACQVLTYMLVFFSAMIAHELAMEAASKEFIDLPGFANSATLVQFAFCFLLPLIITKGKALNRFPTTPSQALPYVQLSLVVFGATALASQALVYVTYPTKVVFKSAKLIPTMVVSTCWNKASYRWMDYLAALLLCVGAAGYSYSSGGGPEHSSWPGLLLLVISVLCDALVPNLQQQFMSQGLPSNGPKIPILQPSKESDGVASSLLPLSPAELMVNVNAVGCLGLFLYMACSGHLVAVVQTTVLHPRLATYLLLIGLGLSTAVLAYTRLIQASGSVVAVAVSTLRKVVTVTLSYIVFPKQLLTIHVVSGVAVLGGIVLSSYSSKQGRTSRK
jgi:solute carrier family 35 (adenosine 3'-phospho 5'-phosphosulfate transporter), member B3